MSDSCTDKTYVLTTSRWSLYFIVTSVISLFCKLQYCYTSSFSSKNNGIRSGMTVRLPKPRNRQDAGSCSTGYGAVGIRFRSIASAIGGVLDSLAIVFIFSHVSIGLNSCFKYT